MLTRENIIETLRAALEPRPDVYAMWQSGAASFNRVDEWSDIDLQVDVDDAAVSAIAAASTAALNALSPIVAIHTMPQPTWHGHSQTFYQLRDASPFLLLDFVIIKHSAANKFIQPEIHGSPRVVFDKANVVRAEPLDRDAFNARLRARVETLRVLFPMFQTLTLKELHRRNWIEAFSFYQNWTIRPLLEVLHMRYAPLHFDFNTRYLYYDLPPDIVKKLEPYFFVADPADLAAKRAAAAHWFTTTLEQLSI